MPAVDDSSFQNEHMINSEKTTPDEAPGDETVHSVVDRIMIDFGLSLEEKDGFVGLGSELATLSVASRCRMKLKYAQRLKEATNDQG